MPRSRSLRHRRLLPAAALGLLGWLAPIPSSGQEEAAVDEGWLVEEGGSAPAFELAGVDGETHRLSDFADRPVVVVFWGSW